MIDEEQELNTNKAFSPIGNEAKLDDLQACHNFDKEEFESKIDSKYRRDKSEDLHQLKFPSKLFLSKSMKKGEFERKIDMKYLRDISEDLHQLKFRGELVP